MMKPEDSTITVQGGTIDCCLHTWNGGNDDDDDDDNSNKNKNKKKKDLVIIFHGFAAHGMYPTVRYAAEKLATTSNYVVVAPDLPGHGLSNGLSGYISSANHLIDVAVDIVHHVCNQYCNDNNKFFLLGSSMGGTISLAVAQRLQQEQQQQQQQEANNKSTTAVAGVVLLAPMLMLNVSSPARYLLQGLSSLPIISTLAVIPSNSTSPDQQYRDKNKRIECQNDSLSYSGNMRIGSASACVELAELVQSQFTFIKFPFLLMVADEDVVVKNQGSFDLMEKSITLSTDKTMKRYPALHGLLCEPEPLVTQIQNDMVEWMDSR